MIVTYQHPGENGLGALSILLCPFDDPFVARRVKGLRQIPNALEQGVLTGVKIRREQPLARVKDPLVHSRMRL
jgi:hypothetical protein